MSRDSGAVEQAVARTLRDNLETLQRTAEELTHAVSDLVAACASARPANSLPPMLRAQTAAASLAASLEVLSRFVTASMYPAAPAAEPELPEPPPQMAAQWETVPPAAASTISEMGIPPTSVVQPAVELSEPVAVPAEEPLPGPVGSVEGAPPGTFDVAGLPPEQQELHRRASRVAKVSMQDIKMLRPEEVRLGRENKDICARLRDEIEKARREYDRRFQAILGHPVDYFYDWMVEILGDGDPAALGEYPYSSPVARR